MPTNKRVWADGWNRFQEVMIERHRLSFYPHPRWELCAPVPVHCSNLQLIARNSTGKLPVPLFFRRYGMIRRETKAGWYPHLSVDTQSISCRKTLHWTLFCFAELNNNFHDLSVPLFCCKHHNGCLKLHCVATMRSTLNKDNVVSLLIRSSHQRTHRPI